MFVTAQGDYHVINSLTTLFLHAFLLTFIYLKIFYYVPIFNRFIQLVSVYAIACVHLIAYVINSNSCLVSNLLDMNYEYYVG